MRYKSVEDIEGRAGLKTEKGANFRQLRGTEDSSGHTLSVDIGCHAAKTYYITCT